MKVGHLGSIKLGPVTTLLTPHDKPDAGRSRVTKRYRRTQRRLPRPLSARRVVSSIARGSPVVRRKAVTGKAIPRENALLVMLWQSVLRAENAQ